MHEEALGVVCFAHELKIEFHAGKVLNKRLRRPDSSYAAVGGVRHIIISASTLLLFEVVVDFSRLFARRLPSPALLLYGCVTYTLLFQYVEPNRYACMVPYIRLRNYVTNVPAFNRRKRRRGKRW